MTSDLEPFRQFARIVLPILQRREIHLRALMSHQATSAELRELRALAGLIGRLAAVVDYAITPSASLFSPADATVLAELPTLSADLLRSFKAATNCISAFSSCPFTSQMVIRSR